MKMPKWMVRAMFCKHIRTYVLSIPTILLQKILTLNNVYTHGTLMLTSLHFATATVNFVVTNRKKCE